MRFLVDTSTLINFTKGREPARSRLLEMAATPDEIGVCAVIVAEIFAGAAPAERPIWQRFFRGVTHWEITPHAAEQAGIYRYTYARQGRALATVDSVIAAVAIDIGAVLITGNVKDFPMPGLTLLPL